MRGVEPTPDFTDQQCCAVMFSESIRGRACPHRAKVCRNGKYYCGKHDPEIRALRRAQRIAKWDEQRALEQALKHKTKMSKVSRLAAALGIELTSAQTELLLGIIE